MEVGGLVVGAKIGALTVEIVDDVGIRWTEGRRLAWEGGALVVEGESRAGPSKGEGDGGSRVGVDCTKVGVSSRCSVETCGLGGVTCLVTDGSGRGKSGVTFLLLVLLALLTWRDGLVGMLRLLLGRAKGLLGRSEWLIWDGRRTKGLVFSGDREPFFVGDRLGAALVGDRVGVVARTVAGEAEFFLAKGDCRPESLKESGRTDDCIVLAVSLKSACRGQLTMLLTRRYRLRRDLCRVLTDATRLFIIPVADGVDNRN